MASQGCTNDELSRCGQEKGNQALSTSTSLYSATSSSVQFRENVDQLPTFSIPEGFDSPSAAASTAGVPSELDGLVDGVEAASLQQRRLSLFDYQPFSLPPSRVCSPIS